jgi:hypothetical protein
MGISLMASITYAQALPINLRTDSIGQNTRTPIPSN